MLNIAYKIHFFLGKNFGGTRHPYEKNEPTLDHSWGGGVHGKACWLIAYKSYTSYAYYECCKHLQ